jgi:hypothetical protein
MIPQADPLSPVAQILARANIRMHYREEVIASQLD